MTDVIVSGRATGKTTRLLQEVIDYLAEESGDAIVVCHDQRWAETVDLVRCSGLVGVHVVSANNTIGLRGKRGAIFIDNAHLTELGIYDPMFLGFEIRLVTARPMEES